MCDSSCDDGSESGVRLVRCGGKFRRRLREVGEGGEA